MAPPNSQKKITRRTSTDEKQPGLKALHKKISKEKIDNSMHTVEEILKSLESGFTVIKYYRKTDKDTEKIVITGQGNEFNIKKSFNGEVVLSEEKVAIERVVKFVSSESKLKFAIDYAKKLKK